MLGRSYCEVQMLFICFRLSYSSGKIGARPEAARTRAREIDRVYTSFSLKNIGLVFEGKATCHLSSTAMHKIGSREGLTTIAGKDKFY
jgi:hypothetical protein